MKAKYIIKPENMTTEVKWKTADTLAEAREIARYSVSNATGEPARAGIYFDDEECIEVWEDGKRIWFGGHIVRGINIEEINIEEINPPAIKTVSRPMTGGNMTDKLTKAEIEFLKTDHGYERIIHTEKGEIQAIKNGKRVFVGWNADDVRRMNPAMIAALTRFHR